jgi:hypothetical protein
MGHQEGQAAAEHSEIGAAGLHDGVRRFTIREAMVFCC